MRGLILRALLLLAAWGLASPAGFAASPSPAAVHLVDLMGQRLAVSREVAWTKYEKQLPVRDLKREGELLASLVQKGAKQGVPESGVRSFFNAQILASCAVQEELMSGWKVGKPIPDHPPQDLLHTIRPELDTISGSMLEILSGLGPNLHDPDLERYATDTLVKEGYSENAASIAVAPFH
jgi:chorismate mutase